MTSTSRNIDHTVDVKQIAKKRIEEKVLVCIKQANDFFKTSISVPNIKLNQRGRAAGTAYLQRNEVRFNYYMYCQNSERFIENVVPHEIAHLVVFNLYGLTTKPHGDEWQQVMQRLYGVPAARTHNFLPEPPKNIFIYQCDCQKHELSVRRHNRIVQGGQYVCKLCRTALQSKNQT